MASPLRRLVKISFFLCSGVLVLRASEPLNQNPDTSLQLARGLQEKGSLGPALKAYEALASQCRKTGNQRILAEALLRGGETALQAGNYTVAIEHSTEAAVAFARNNDKKNESAAINVVGLARLYRGEYQPALENFRRALVLDRQSGNAESGITHLNNVANVYFFQGRYLEALNYYQSALKQTDKQSGPNWDAQRAMTLVNLGVLYQQVGQYQNALDYYRRAQELAGVLPPAEYGQVLSNFGTLYRRLGDPVKAIATYRAAQGVFARGLHSDAEIHVLQNIGIVLALDLRSLARAEAIFSEALALAQRTSNQRQSVLAHLFRGETYYRESRPNDAQREFEIVLTSADQFGGSEEKWTALYKLGQLRQNAGDLQGALRYYQQSTAIIESLRSGLNRGSLQTEFLANKREVYDAAIALLLEMPGADREQIFELMERARERTLQDKLPNQNRPTIQSVQSRLRSTDAVIEYWTGQGKLAALRIDRQGTEIIKGHLSSEDVEAIRRFPAELQADRTALDTKAGKTVAAVLFVNRLASMKNVTDLFLIPDGILNYVPFEALPLGKSFVVERFAISYLPTTSLLIRTNDVRSAAPPWKLELAAFGDPKSPSRSEAMQLDQQWPSLPFSREEIRDISKLLPGRAKAFLGPSNRKEFLSSELVKEVPILHIATHATINTAHPEQSHILFSPGTEQPGSEYLFLREAQALNLANTDLVTLSMCGIEGGTTSPGEGLHSFSRAFLAAGARATVTTLWKVADEPTAEFMKQFYFYLARGLSKAASLRQAKLNLLRSHSKLAQPRYWAAFVLYGDGRAPIPPVFSWVKILLLSLAAASIAVLLIRTFLRSRLRLEATRLQRQNR